MTTIIPDPQLPRRTESGMHTRAVNAAAGVLLAAMENGRQTPTGLAIALDSACLLNSPEHAAEHERLRERSTAVPVELPPEQRATIAAHLANAKPATNALVAGLAKTVRDVREHEHPTWEDLYCLNLVSYMGERMAPVLRRLLDAEARVAALEARLADYDRPTGTYPPALPWAALMDADDLEGFLEDLVDAASGDDDLSTLTEVESTIARWRAIGEAQHAHNTAPGPDAGEVAHVVTDDSDDPEHVDDCPGCETQQTGGDE